MAITAMLKGRMQMTQIRKVAWVILRGFVAGGMLSVVTPPKAVVAACKCDDGGSGMYQCNSGQTACNPGHEVCLLICS